MRPPGPLTRFCILEWTHWMGAALLRPLLSRYWPWLLCQRLWVQLPPEVNFGSCPGVYMDLTMFSFRSVTKAIMFGKYGDNLFIWKWEFSKFEFNLEEGQNRSLNKIGFIFDSSLRPNGILVMSLSVSRCFRIFSFRYKASMCETGIYERVHDTWFH